jgi:hypothetical protein
VLNCYHAFTGSKGTRDLSGNPLLELELKRLDKHLLYTWYRENEKNRYGRDLSKPLQYPHVMYSPPPDKWFPNLCYNILWTLFAPKKHKVLE